MRATSSGSTEISVTAVDRSRKALAPSSGTRYRRPKSKNGSSATAVKMTHGRGRAFSSSSAPVWLISESADDGAAEAAHGKKANGRIQVKS
jgi:hypothetical protein